MEKVQLGNIPFVRMLIPLMLGIYGASIYTPSEQQFSIYSSGSIVLFILTLLYIAFFKRNTNIRSAWLMGLLISSVVFLGTYLLTAYKSQFVLRDHFSQKKFEILAVVIRTEPKKSGSVVRFEADVLQGYKSPKFYAASGRLLIALQTDSLKKYSYGDLLFISADYSEVEPPFNPNEFDYKAYLANHEVYHQIFLTESKLRLIKHDQGNLLIAKAHKLREVLVSKLEQYIDNRDASSLASTLILGYRADLSKDVIDAYSKTGTMHVLSVSGMHVGIVFVVMIFLFKIMDRSKKLRLIRAALMIALIWFYAGITGFSAAVCRAALMISFVVIGKALNRNQNTYNIIAISAVFLLIYDPFLLFDVGFQLSYLAVLGLVYLYPKIYNLFIIKSWLGDKLWSYMALSTAAQIATFPLSVYYFHQFPVYFLISNLLIVLPVTIIMYAGLVFLFIPWGFLLKPLGWLLTKSIVLTNQGLFCIEELPSASIHGIWISAQSSILIYVLIVLIVFTFHYKRKSYLYLTLATVGFLLASYSFAEINRQRQHKVIFYSLRKNSAIGFFNGEKAWILTDLSASDKAFTYSIKPSIEFSRLNDFELVQTAASFSRESLFIRPNFIQFRDWTLLIWDKKFDRRTFSKNISVDAVLLRENPEIDISDLRRMVDFKILLVDANNADDHIEKWNEQAVKVATNYHVLKRNNAYLVIFND